MSIMNAEVMAENRPASGTDQPCWLCEREEAHKNESGVQIASVHFLEVFVVFVDFLLELRVENSSGVGAAILVQQRLQDVT